MVVIYAEKSSLAKEIAAALHAGNRIAHSKEPTIGHYEFTFKGEKAILPMPKHTENSLQNGI